MKNFITTKWIRRKGRIRIFAKQELEKNVKEKTNAYITFQARLWCKECHLIHLEGLMSADARLILFLLMQLKNCQMEKLKNLVNVFTICWKTRCFSISSLTFLFPDETALEKHFFGQVSWGYQITPWRRRMWQNKFDSV